jgi:hypothetical protein
MAARFFALLAVVAVEGCMLTTATCDCLAADSRLVVYGVVRHEMTGETVTNARVTLTLGESGAPVRACVFPFSPTPDDPAPVLTDSVGHYRLEVLSTAGLHRCLQVAAERELPAPRLGRLLTDLEVAFGLPGTIDSMRLDIAVVPQ